MAEPIDAILAIHNAFRNDLERIDAAALDSARGMEGLGAIIERFRFFNEVLVWHANGEELAVFPVLENVAPLVAEAYVKDHRCLDSAFDTLSKSYSARDLSQIARATAAFRFHLNIHLDKEDTHLYRIFKERVSLPEQGKAVGVMSKAIPQERYPEFVAWMFPLIGHDDRENMIRIMQIVMPAPAFTGVEELIKKAIGSDWAELMRRIPTL
ncbi:MAG: hemerythrin domain-containing protein [Methanotrichaceae archaeon]|nr:hemerythrin domain-containing protein [Methanotrichaceae archaeon]